MYTDLELGNVSKALQLCLQYQKTYEVHTCLLFQIFFQKCHEKVNLF